MKLNKYLTENYFSTHTPGVDDFYKNLEETIEDIKVIASEMREEINDKSLSSSERFWCKKVEMEAKTAINSLESMAKLIKDNNS